MSNKSLHRFSTIVFGTVLAAFGVPAQQHDSAGRTAGELEWFIHQRIAAIPSYSVFDLIRFKVHGKTVILSGQVSRPDAKDAASKAITRVSGVANVVDRIEVLPSSRQDDRLRQGVYSAIYEREPSDKFLTDGRPRIRIIVKNGWVKLEGEVDSDADRTVAHLRALSAAVHVADNLQLTPLAVLG